MPNTHTNSLKDNPRVIFSEAYFRNRDSQENKTRIIFSKVVSDWDGIQYDSFGSLHFDDLKECCVEYIQETNCSEFHILSKNLSKLSAVVLD